MITWNKNLYVHKDIEKDIQNIINDVDNKKYAKIYCIIRALSEQNLFEILSLAELTNGLYTDKDIEVYGVAKGKDNIKDILIDMVESTIDKDGNILISKLYE
jgi:hypothetical protein